MEVQNADRHLKARLVAAYLEGRLETGVRGEVEDHLAACADCRREVVEVGRLVAGRRRTRLLLPAAGLAAAAVLVVFAGVSLIGGEDAGSPASAVRTQRTPSMTALSALRPATDAVLPSGQGIDFVWNAAAAGSTYRLTLLDGTGAAVWSAETSDTVARLPAAIALEGAKAYFWFVDALSPDGSTLTSGARRFSLQ